MRKRNYIPDIFAFKHKVSDFLGAGKLLFLLLGKSALLLCFQVIHKVVQTFQILCPQLPSHASSGDIRTLTT